MFCFSFWPLELFDRTRTKWSVEPRGAMVAELFISCICLAVCSWCHWAVVIWLGYLCNDADTSSTPTDRAVQPSHFTYKDRQRYAKRYQQLNLWFVLDLFTNLALTHTAICAWFNTNGMQHSINYTWCIQKVFGSVNIGKRVLATCQSVYYYMKYTEWVIAKGLARKSDM